MSSSPLVSSVLISQPLQPHRRSWRRARKLSRPRHNHSLPRRHVARHEARTREAPPLASSNGRMARWRWDLALRCKLGSSPSAIRHSACAGRDARQAIVVQRVVQGGAMAQEPKHDPPRGAYHQSGAIPIRTEQLQSILRELPTGAVRYMLEEAAHAWAARLPTEEQ